MNSKFLNSGIWKACRVALKKPVLQHTLSSNFNRQFSLGAFGTTGGFLSSFAYQNLIKPTLFTAAGVGLTYTAFIMKQEMTFQYAIKKYPEYFKKVLGYFDGNWGLAWNSYLQARGTDPNDKCIIYFKTLLVLSIPVCSMYCASYWSKYIFLYYVVRFFIYSLLFIVFLTIYILVFLAWRVPGWRGIMNKYFLCRPTTSPCSSIFLSSFSHMDGWHILCNMIGLYSFGSIVFDKMGTDHFYAFYLSSAFVSGLASYLAKFVFHTVGIASLGASGAVYAISTYAMMERPDLRVSLIFLPFLGVPCSYALFGLAAFELYSLFFKSFGFDNMAHLGGMAYGGLYKKYIGPVFWTKYRTFLVSKYRSMTNFKLDLNSNNKSKSWKKPRI
ncbi:hypothetical protein WA158_002523 [Blastocystis sp. Blastoise]